MAEKMVVLYNKDRFQPFQATMYHSVVCKHGQCYCTYKDAGPLTASKQIREEASFRIEPRKYSAALPAAVLDIPQVRVAMTKETPQLVEANQLAKIQRIPGGK